jgi:alpha-glucosidase
MGDRTGGIMRKRIGVAAHAAKMAMIVAALAGHWLFNPVTEAAETQKPAPVFTAALTSPDGRIAIEVGLQGTEPVYRASFKGKPAITTSRLGFVLQDGPSLHDGLKIASLDRRRHDAVWTQVWGEEKEIREHYNELSVRFEAATGPARTLLVAFRVFNDGFGFRYEIPAQPGIRDIKVKDEITEFAMAKQMKAWWIRAYQGNRFEYQYAQSALDAVDVVHTPLTMEAGDMAVSIHEAALVDFASMTLRRPDIHGYTLKADLVPWADGMKVYGKAPMKSPWRTVQIADRAFQLLDSRLILNLNEPNKLDDVSWIKPMKFVGIWWCMHIRSCTWEPGPKQGATTQEAKRYIDFAAKNGFPGLLVEGWNVGWDKDWFKDGSNFRFAEPVKGFDIEETIAYGRKKGVALVGHHETGADIKNYESQLEAAFAFYRKLGVHAVKTGYVGERVNKTEWHHGQLMVRHFEKVMQTAARNKVTINAHEPVKDTGLRRTWPHMMTREAARGQEYDAWGPVEAGNQPDHTTILPFTRMLSGPMDYTPGIVKTRFPGDAPGTGHGISSTVAKQLALYVVIYSPLHMAADLPENYEGHPALPFIRQVPVDWSRSIALDGIIGDYVVQARKDRNSEDWYIGAVTDEKARTLTVNLDFLDKKKSYRAEIYADGPGADWIDAPEALNVSQRIVRATDSLSIVMAPGGGQAIRLVPID